MFAARKVTGNIDTTGYLSERVYDGKRTLDAGEIARRKDRIKNAADAVKQTGEAGDTIESPLKRTL
ncbi:hypothetical protein SAE02_50290 [Skermanella aerolata]|uniref:Uncharacterized protein n=1 Tax=Skermanella aerolata TaxID=393310 RepID=A0A512DWP1_9PROT|nr:hypothetical protein [Skermanella aerolata]KJB93778.1 hypothetical protein N826_14095 [Skermanella aerolata KACC 11604]GEO40881.1 hypothetical protein SAE02_50290 [Skermanella aerolata]